jgi:hypothetical protein
MRKFIMGVGTLHYGGQVTLQYGIYKSLCIPRPENKGRKGEYHYCKTRVPELVNKESLCLRVR